MSTKQCSLLLAAAGLALLIRAMPALGQPPAGTGKPAAVVNGEPIMFEDVRALAERPTVVPLPKEQRVEIYKAALEMLIDDLLIRQYLRKNAPPPNPVEVEKEWKELNSALAKKLMTLDEFLRESRQTVDQLKADIAARVQWRAYLDVRFTTADLQAYYNANKVFFDKTMVRASHILLKATTPVERDKARQQLEVFRQDILTGRYKFEDIAQKYSDCPSKERGGDIGKFPYKFIVVEPFARAAFSMRVGEISGVVESEFGMHLIKVTERIEGSPSRFDEVRETVKETYAQEIQLYQNIMSEQRSRAAIKREVIEVLLK